MKIKIEPGGHLTPEEIEEIESLARVASDEDVAEQMSGVNTIVIPEAVVMQLKEMGMTPDDLVAMYMKKAKKLS